MIRAAIHRQILSRVPQSSGAAIKRTLASLNLQQPAGVSSAPNSQYMLHCAVTVAALAGVSAICTADLASEHIKRGQLSSVNHVFHDHQHFR
jgi:hypothetical protein